MSVTEKPMFLRKLVGHRRSVVSLIEYGDFVFSFDSAGLARIWKSKNYQFYKVFRSLDLILTSAQSFELNFKILAPPVIARDRLWCPDGQSIKVLKIEDILHLDITDPVAETIPICSEDGEGVFVAYIHSTDGHEVSIHSELQLCG